MNQQIQLAYNKGLDDAENRIIDNFLNILKDPKYDVPFLNPRLEPIRQVIKKRSDLIYGLTKKNTNVGRAFKKVIAEHKEILENVK
jgi:hypothetical protein